MSIFTHLFLAFGAACTLWLLSGIVIDATERVARRYNKPGFAVAFFVLGLLTSISEISVAANATLEGVPQVSAGNLLGASTVIFLLIIPLLATLGNGIPMTHALNMPTIALLLGVVLVPALFAVDGSVSPTEGLVMILFYVTALYCVQKRQPIEQTATDAVRETEHLLFHNKHATALDIAKILVGALVIFFAGDILVEESVYFALRLHVPVSCIGILLLSLGTNIPELVIAVRCILGRHKDIAFGDYLGSGAANTLVFGLLPLLNGPFGFEKSEALLTSLILGGGLVLFFLFARSKNVLSRGEGIVLLCCYGIFLVFQFGNAIRLSGDTSPASALHRAAMQ